MINIISRFYINNFNKLNILNHGMALQKPELIQKIRLTSESQIFF